MLLVFISFCVFFQLYNDGLVWIHKANLIPPLFIEVPVPSQESERSCFCIDLVSFYDFSIEFWNCCYRVVYVVFHFIVTTDLMEE